MLSLLFMYSTRNIFQSIQGEGEFKFYTHLMHSPGIATQSVQVSCTATLSGIPEVHSDCHMGNNPWASESGVKSKVICHQFSATATSF